MLLMSCSLQVLLSPFMFLRKYLNYYAGVLGFWGFGVLGHQGFENEDGWTIGLIS